MALEEKIKELREYVFEKKCSTSVIGMPGIGKTRLLENALVDYNAPKKEVYENVILVNVHVESDADFIRILADGLYSELRNKSYDVELLEQWKKICDKISSTSEINDIKSSFSFLKIILGKTVNVIICIDDFHYVPVSGHRIIRKLSENLGLIFVIASVYPIEFLEPIETNKQDLHKAFEHSISLTPFDNVEFAKFFRKKVENNLEMESFQQQIIKWSGGVPAIFTKCVEKLGYGYSEEQILKIVIDQYNLIENIVKEQNLLNETIQIVIGPVNNIEHTKLMTLLDYGYLRKVDVEYKRNLLKEYFDDATVENYLGFEDKDGFRYVLFSDCYTLTFIKKYRFERAYFPIWCRTESLLRKLVHKYFRIHYGDDCERKIIGTIDESAWSIAEKNRIQEGKKDRDILEYLDTSVLLKGLILGKEFWKYYNSRVFLGSKRDWIDKFEKLLAVRRTLCHSRDVDYDSRFNAERICEEISEKINKSGVLLEKDLSQKVEVNAVIDEKKDEKVNALTIGTRTTNMTYKKNNEDFVCKMERDIAASSLPESDKSKLLSNLLLLNGKKVNLLITGATGCGKSSTINALFDADVSKVGVGVDPETMDIEKYELGNLVLWDSPGLGDDTDADKRHASHLKSKLLERDFDGDPVIDLVLVILDGRTRDMKTSFDLISNVIIPNLGEDKSRILVAINQADVAMNGRHWDHENNRPKPELETFLQEKVESVKRRIKESTGVSVEPVFYSAGFKDKDDEQRPYNLTKLLYQIIHYTPKEKRSVYMDNINRKREMWQDDDRLKDYQGGILDDVVAFLGLPGRIIVRTASRVVDGVVDLVNDFVGPFSGFFDKK